MTTSPFRVSNLGEASVESLCTLFERVFQLAIVPAQWRWKYHGAPLQAHVNMGLLQGDELLGHAGAVILPALCDGEAVTMAQVCDVMLAPSVRGMAGPQGAYAQLMRGLINELDRAFPGGMHYGFPGLRPFGLGQRLGVYRGTGKIMQSSFDARPGLSHWWRLSRLAWDDERLDGLWSQFATRPGCSLVRDRPYLLWRYASNPFRCYQLLGLRCGLRLVGWVVLCCEAEQLRVVDTLCATPCYTPLLTALCSWARSQGLSSVVCWDPPAGLAKLVAAKSEETAMVGVVMTSSAPRFAHVCPLWQAGDCDVY